MKKLYLILASGFGIGYLKPFPGGFGSLEGFFISWLFFNLLPFTRYIIIIFLIFLSLFIANEAEKIYNRKDPHEIVIDEIVGVLTASLFILNISESLNIIFFKIPLSLFLAFLLFVVFDSFKPFPANYFQNFKGGLGVVLDDVISGIYAGLFVLILNMIKF